MGFYRPKNLLNNLLMIDGTARCGKSLLSPILASLENVEIERVEEIFDYISVSWFFGDIEKDCAISMIRAYADASIYNSYLSRNTNFRWSDHSSVFKNPNPLRYFRRLFENEGQETISRIQRDSPIFQTQGHDQIRFINLLLEAWPGSFKMIEIVRDPIDMIDAWWRRGWGTRFCTDPMDRTPCVRFGDKAVPFYAYGWEEEYLELPPVDRIVKMQHILQFLNRESYEKLSDKDKHQIKVIRFESLVSETSQYVDEIAKFLETKTTKYTQSAIKKQGCPRYQPPEKRNRRYSNIKNEASKMSLQLIEEMIEDYKNDWT